MFSSESLIVEGDHVILFVSRDSVDCVQLERSKAYSCKHGHFPHSEIIGKPYGSQIIAKNKKGFLYALRPTPELWTLALPHRTQILYHPDIAFITASLDIRPGSRVAEAGTGSGSFTHSIARTVGSNGKVYSFEYHAERFEKARAEFQSHGLATVSVEHRDVVKDGLALDNEVDAVFLDLPSPELAIVSAKKALKKDRLGRICCFSPCIEQVIKTVAELSKEGFSEITMFETLVRNYDVVNAALPSVSTAIERITHIEKKKGIRREQQIAAAAARRAAKKAAAEEEVSASMSLDNEEVGTSMPAEEASAKRPADAVDGLEVSESPAKRLHLDESIPAQTTPQPLVKHAKTPNKNVALQRAMRDGEMVHGARPLLQARGHTSYLTFATLVPTLGSLRKEKPATMTTANGATLVNGAKARGLERTVSGLVVMPSQEAQTLVQDISLSTPDFSTNGTS